MDTTTTAEPSGHTASRSWIGRVVRWTMFLLVLSVLLVLCVVPGPLLRTEARLHDGFAFATVDGREIMVLTYDDLGFAGPILAGRHGEHIVAIDVATGETVWEKSLGHSTSLSEVLAADADYAYVRHIWGFLIVSMADGEVVARDEEIDGLGEDFYERHHGYAYSVERDAIMTITRSGAVKEIPIGTTEAVEVDVPTRDTWSCVLGFLSDFGPTPPSYDGLSESVNLPNGVLLSLQRPAGAPAGLPTQRLVLGTDSGGHELLETSFVGAGFVMEVHGRDPAPEACPTARGSDDVYPRGEATAAPVGLSTGQVVVQGKVDANSEDSVLHVIEVENGTIAATARAERGYTRAVTSPSGHVAIMADTYVRTPLSIEALVNPSGVVFLLDRQGDLRRVVLGEHGWFGV